MTETKSSKEWLNSKVEDRLLSDGSRNHRGADDPTPRALLAKIRARMKRRTLQTSQFFSFCDSNRSGAITPYGVCQWYQTLGYGFDGKATKGIMEGNGY